MTILTQKRLKEILEYDPDTGIFIRIKTSSLKIKPGVVAGGKAKSGHIQITIDGDLYYAHRLAFLYMTGEMPDEHVDHMNGDAADNKWQNLRCASSTQNLLNRGVQKNNTSGYKNVSWCKIRKKWAVRLQQFRKNIVIGYFDSAEEANEKAIAARKRIQGEFAIDNRCQA